MPSCEVRTESAEQEEQFIAQYGPLRKWETTSNEVGLYTFPNVLADFESNIRDGINRGDDTCPGYRAKAGLRNFQVISASAFQS